MIKITVFGFYCPDDSQPGEDCRSPVNTRDFMRVVWELEPPASRVGHDPDMVRFAKLTELFIHPVYVQALSDEMASSAGLLKSDGYIAIIDAVKILAPNAIRAALRRLATLNPRADLIIAAGRQNEPEALSSDEIREVLELHPSLLVMPYVPDQPKTVYRIIRRLVRYIDNPQHVPTPIFAGDVLAVPAVLDAAPPPPEDVPAPIPRIHGMAGISVPVREMGRALVFYRDLLGFRVLGPVEDPERQGRAVLHLDTGRGVLQLVEVGAARNGASPAHLLLRVVALDALVTALAGAGARVIAAPAPTPYGVRRAVLADPDGSLVELVEGEVSYPRR